MPASNRWNSGRGNHFTADAGEPRSTPAWNSGREKYFTEDAIYEPRSTPAWNSGREKYFTEDAIHEPRTMPAVSHSNPARERYHTENAIHPREAATTYYAGAQQRARTAPYVLLPSRYENRYEEDHDPETDSDCESDPNDITLAPFAAIDNEAKLKVSSRRANLAAMLSKSSDVRAEPQPTPELIVPKCEKTMVNAVNTRYMKEVDADLPIDITAKMEYVPTTGSARKPTFRWM
jgi:hypothetical protein